jgi:hypothetical protein
MTIVAQDDSLGGRITVGVLRVIDAMIKKIITIYEKFKMKKKVFFITIGLLLFFSLSENSLAYKKEKYPDKVENRFIVTPVRYDLKLKPGQEIIEKVIVVNRLGEREDFFAEIEGFDNQNKGNLNSSVDWIKPELEKFSLDQGERIEFDLKINVPENLSPAGYYANLIVSNQRNSQEDERGQKINLINRISIPLFSTIPGEFDLRGELINFFSDKFFYFKGPVILEANFLNKGNIHLYPEGEIEVYNLLNKQIYQKELDSETILPNDQQKWKISLNNRIFIGRYKAVFMVNYGDDVRQVSKEEVFWAFPLHLLLLIILIIYLIHFIVKKIKENYEVVKKNEKKENK